MWMLYLYLAIAGLGIISMPSFGVWFKANYVFNSYILRRRKEDDYDSGYLYAADWWKLNLELLHKETEDIWALPPAVFIGFLLWPAVLGIFASIKFFKYSTKLLALPGKTFVKLTADKKEAGKYLAEANKEVEKLLLDAHEDVRKNEH